MNGILPLTYVSTYEELHTVGFRLATSAAVKTAKCSLIRLVNEANLVQYRCHLSLPQVPITVERKSWRTDAVLRGLPADILDVDLENVTADAYVTYLCARCFPAPIVDSTLAFHRLWTLLRDYSTEICLG
ncbi:hypothetical protein SprV_0602242600 [Sparganum proliferum]